MQEMHTVSIQQRQFLMRHNMIESLQGCDVPGQLGLSQRSGNVSLVPSWTS